jgi:hypothetical protein
MITHSGFEHERRYRIHPDVVTEPVGPELLLVQLAQGTTFRLNASGTAIWQMAIAGHTTAEIAEQLHARLGTSPTALAQDTSGLLAELAQNALLQPLAETAP